MLCGVSQTSCCSRRCAREGESCAMEQPSTHQTVKENLRPTSAQERALEEVLWRCRALYNGALEQRITASQRRRDALCVSGDEQEAELKAMRAEVSEYAAIHSPLLHDVLGRWDTRSQASCPRRQRGEQAGFPRFTGRNRSLPRVHPQRVHPQGVWHRGATGEGLPGALAWCSGVSGASGCRGVARLRAPPGPSRSRGRPTAGRWRSRVPREQCLPAPHPGM